MATTITYPGGTIVPTVVFEYASTRETRTVVHQILGRSAPDVTIRPAALRSGTLHMLFSPDREADSKACEDAHATGVVFTLGGEERTSIPMSYVASGAIRRILDPETVSVWIVEIDFHEVLVVT